MAQEHEALIFCEWLRDGLTTLEKELSESPTREVSADEEADRARRENRQIASSDFVARRS